MIRTTQNETAGLTFQVLHSIHRRIVNPHETIGSIPQLFIVQYVGLRQSEQLEIASEEQVSQRENVL